MLIYLFILQVGQQEPERELEATLDEVANQLDKQTLEEKEKDDDDEGKYHLCDFVLEVFLK